MNGFASLGQPPRIEPPYPAWPVEQIVVVEEAITTAMQRVLAEKLPQDIVIAKENDITNWLEDELCSLLDTDAVAGFSYFVFEKPRRGSEKENYNGTKISKKPDLLFQRLGNPAGVMDTRQDAWFCECKILEAKSKHTLKEYIEDGLMRFVEGDYAWAMPSAQMIGYARHIAVKDFRPTNQLSEYFTKTETKTGKTYAALTGLITEKTQMLRAAGTPPIHATTHVRSFPLRDNGTPGPITLRHLWFQMI